METKVTCFKKTINVVSTEFRWIIGNYTSLCTTVEFIKSPVFQESSTEYPTWQFKLFPNGTIDNKEYVSLIVFQKDCDNEIIADCVFSIIKRNRSHYIKLYGKQKFQKGTNLRFNLIKRSDLNNPNKAFMKDDTLEILCKIKKYTIGEHKNNDFYINVYNQPQKMLQDFQQIRFDERFSDVCLVVRNIKFPVHKNILAARSPVFAAMFEQDTEEQQEDEIQIQDIEPEIMRALISFIYTGSADNLDDKAIEVLKAAAKYKLEGLKILCEKTIEKILSADNVVEVLQTADLYNNEGLKRLAMDFIKMNLKAVMDFNYDSLKSSTSILIEIFNLLSSIDRKICT